MIPKTRLIFNKLIQGNLQHFGSYYRTVSMYTEVENISSNKEKQAKIQEFQNSLSEQDQKELNNLQAWYSRKQSTRISLKIINKYYLNKCVAPAQYSLVEPELAQGGVMKKVCKEDKQSELSLYDVNIFLRYLCALQGTGSQGEKAKKVLQFGQNVSVLEGMFLLKLIEHQLNIGVGSKTFRKIAANKEEPKEKTASTATAKQTLNQIHVQPISNQTKKATEMPQLDAPISPVQ